ncbi:MAG: HAMP domain-containing sensor histidine kinase [Anaerolineae bacterium]
MQNKRLAQWIEEHSELLSRTEQEADQALHAALYEGVIDMALNGETRMVNSLLESAAAHAVAVGRPLTHLLGVPQRLRERLWERIGEEIDPEPAFVMLSAVDVIFVHIVRVTIDAYVEGTRLATAAKATEISRLYAESERKVMEYTAEVARANRELARLEQVKTDFISIAAHELKTPLTLIQGYANILYDLLNEERTLNLADGIRRGAERMNMIIEDMLDLSAIDTNRLSLFIEPVNLNKSIQLIIHQMEPILAQRRHTIQTVDLDKLPPLEADAYRLHQIFAQLINNAIKYTPDGGQITVTGQKVEASRGKPASVRVIVKDTGVGIAPEDREKIFEKFYRAGSSDLHSTGHTKFMGAGPGLGLSIVKGLVEAHQGRIVAESPGFDMQNCPGSSFIVTLPIQAIPRAGLQVTRMPVVVEPDEPETLS